MVSATTCGYADDNGGELGGISWDPGLERGEGGVKRKVGEKTEVVDVSRGESERLGALIK